MFKYLLVAAFALAQLAPLPAAIAYTPPKPPVAQIEVGVPKLHYDVKDAFRFACKVTGYDCKHIALPSVETAELYQWGQLGVYSQGETKVTLDTSLLPYMDKTWIQATLAHEITHYLDYLFKYGDDMQNHACEAEAHAWSVDAQYLIQHGRADLVNVNWQRSYPACQVQEDGAE